MIKGAKWWKFDFHSHTPMSSDYRSDCEEITPRKWLLTHMEREIDCVAVTDHNSGRWIDKLKVELKKMELEDIDGYRPLIIFPGVEISVNGGIHLLAIFDPTKSSKSITQILAKVEYDGTHGESNTTTSESFIKVVETIHKQKGIAIPAHVDKDSGLLTVFSGNTLKNNLNLDGLLALELIDTAFEKPQIYEDLKLNLTEVVGSDSHSLAQIGMAYTWVKMGEPNIKALRLALHDGEDGVIRGDAHPSCPNDTKKRFFIKNISITEGAKAGRGGKPLKINFSPWMTTLIGGRGSGKSSVIEYLRLALKKGDNLPKKLQSEFTDFAKVYKRGDTGMLTDNTKIQTEFYKDGRDIRLKWNKNNISEYHKDEDGNWVLQVGSDNISQRFPIRIYSQKELYEMTKDAQMVLNLIDSRFDKRSWTDKRRMLESEWLESRRKERDLNQLLLNKDNIQAELRDIDAKLVIYEEIVNKNILNDFQNVKMIEQKFSDKLSEIEKSIEPLERNQITKLKIDLNKTIEFLDAESLKLINDKIKEFELLKYKMMKITKEFNLFHESFQQTLESLPWVKHKADIVSEYEKLIQDLKEAGEDDVSNYSNLVEKKQALTNQISDLDKVQKSYEEQKNQSQKIYEEINQHEMKLREDRGHTIEIWNSNNEDLQINLEVFGDTSLGEQSFRSIIRREGTTFSKDIFSSEEEETHRKGFLNQLSKSNEEGTWVQREEVLSNLLSVTADDQKDYSKLFARHIEELKNKTPEDIDRLAIWYPEDLIILKLKVGGKEESIETGSAGQRTAAMLSLLLSIDETPIIIDQPEDDLDTRRITDLIVKGVRQLKQKQQVIIITHNPNITVNGAAEKIVQMNFLSGQIHVGVSGALQDEGVREAVCNVMEGGREALSNRYYRIFKALEK